VNQAAVRRTLAPPAIVVAAFALGQGAGLAAHGHTWIPLPVVVNAAVVGCLTAMFAAGIVLVYRASRVINFATASYGVAAGMLFLLLTVVQQWNFWLAFGAALGAATLLGLLVELLLVRRFARSPRLVLTVVTIAVGQVVAGGIGLLPRAFGLRAEDPIPTEVARTPVSRFSWSWFPLNFRGDHIVAVAVTVLVLAGLAAFFRFSNAGIAIRGASENEERASLLGVNTGALSTLVWTAAAALSGLSALLLLPVQSGSIGSFAIGVGAGTLLRALAR
jgi:branched-subunit amino acid ABC-type transport system permease component